MRLGERDLTPIQDLGAERCVLGAILLRNDALDQVELDPEDFSQPKYREAFSAMLRLRERGKPIDPVTVCDETPEHARSLSMLSGMVADVPTADNVAHYAAIVRDKARLQRLSVSACMLLQRCHEAGAEADEVLAQGAAMVAESARVVRDNTVGMDRLVIDAWKHLAALNEQREGGAVAWGLGTGFQELDVLLGGIQRGVVTILAGRPSMGKSSLARSIAEQVVLSGRGAHVFSAEDSALSYTLRCLADAARVDLHRLRSVRLNKGDLGSLRAAADKLYQPRWLVDDSAGISSAQVAMRVRRHAEKNGTALVVVDYVQLLREQGAKDEREHVERAAVGLQRLARQENVGLLLVSQLSRACEGRPLADRRPVLSDLRESGVLEQIADAVVFLYRDEVYNPQTKTPGEGEAIVRKNKHGRTGTISLQWDGPTATYRPLERYRQAEAL